MPWRSQGYTGLYELGTPNWSKYNVLLWCHWWCVSRIANRCMYIITLPYLDTSKSVIILKIKKICHATQETDIRYPFYIADLFIKTSRQTHSRLWDFLSHILKLHTQLRQYSFVLCIYSTISSILVALYCYFSHFTFRLQSFKMYMQ